MPRRPASLSVILRSLTRRARRSRQLIPLLDRYWLSLGRYWLSLGRYWLSRGRYWLSLGRYWLSLGRYYYYQPSPPLDLEVPSLSVPFFLGLKHRCVYFVGFFRLNRQHRLHAHKLEMLLGQDCFGPAYG